MYVVVVVLTDSVGLFPFASWCLILLDYSRSPAGVSFCWIIPRSPAGVSFCWIIPRSPAGVSFCWIIPLHQLVSHSVGLFPVRQLVSHSVGLFPFASWCLILLDYSRSPAGVSFCWIIPVRQLVSHSVGLFPVHQLVSHSVGLFPFASWCLILLDYSRSPAGVSFCWIIPLRQLVSQIIVA